MVLITGPQEIPGDLYDYYLGTFTPLIHDLYTRLRYPWRKKDWSEKYGHPSWKQILHRIVFKQCVDCFNAQRYTGGATPPAKGARNRSWWYAEAGAMWYYDYFIQQTINLFLADTFPDWCRDPCTDEVLVDSKYPDMQWSGVSYFIVHKNDSPQREIRTFVKTTGTRFNHLFGKLESSLWGLGPDQSFRVEIYDVPGPYESGPVTWNNQPALGTLLRTYNVPKGLIGDWRSIYFGPCAYAFCIVAVDNTSAWIKMTASEYPVEASRPYFED